LALPKQQRLAHHRWNGEQPKAINGNMGKDEYVVRHGVRWMIVRINEDGSESVYEVTNCEERARKIADPRMGAGRSGADQLDPERIQALRPTATDEGTD
jgi:hypothetical protein